MDNTTKKELDYTLGGGNSNIKLLLALKNLDDFYYMITYLELIGLIKEWKFEPLKTATTFLVKDYAFEDDEEKLLMKDSDVKESFYNLDIHTFELFTSINMNVGDKKIKLYESHIAKKGHTQFGFMKDFKGSYTADMIITYDGSDISDDLIVPCTLDTICGNKWYKLNNLNGILDYINLVYWYKIKMKNIINKIPDDYYLVNLSIDVNDNWMYFKKL